MTDEPRGAGTWPAAGRDGAAPGSPATPPRAGVQRQRPPRRPAWVFAGTPRDDGAKLPPVAQEPARSLPGPPRPTAPPPVVAPPAGGLWPAPAPAVRARRALPARILVGSFALVVVFALVVAGLGGLPGMRTVAPVPASSTTPIPTADPATSRSQNPGQRQSGQPAEPTQQGSAGDAGGPIWMLPERTWEPLPQLDPPDEFWGHLQTADVYGQNPVTLLGCPEPAVVQTEDEYRGAVRAQWTCLHAAWVPVYEAMGWSTVEPIVEFYPGKGSKSECGYLEAPAFYCSAGVGTVYFGGDHFVMAQKWDLSVNEMVNHEYGHHIQSLAGLTSAKQQVAATDDVERRSELQATCWSAMMTYNNRSIEFAQEEYDGWQERLETMLVDGVHGSRESLRYWGTRGLYAQTLNDCNTWVVESAHVS